MVFIKHGERHSQCGTIGTIHHDCEEETSLQWVSLKVQKSFSRIPYTYNYRRTAVHAICHTV